MKPTMPVQFFITVFLRKQVPLALAEFHCHVITNSATTHPRKQLFTRLHRNGTVTTTGVVQAVKTTFSFNF